MYDCRISFSCGYIYRSGEEKERKKERKSYGKQYGIVMMMMMVVVLGQKQ